MSLTSYRAAPPRVTVYAFFWNAKRACEGPHWGTLVPFVIVMGFLSSRRLQCLATSYSSNA